MGGCVTGQVWSLGRPRAGAEEWGVRGGVGAGCGSRRTPVRLQLTLFEEVEQGVAGLGPAARRGRAHGEVAAAWRCLLLLLLLALLACDARKW